MFLTGYASFDPRDLTNYSKHLIDRLLIPADPYTPNVIRNLKDKPVRLPQDKRIPTTYIQATEPENAKGGDVWYRS